MNVEEFQRQTSAPARGGVVTLFPSRPDDAERRPFRVAMIGTYAPRKCGIATFTSDTQEQLRKFHPEIEIDIFALDRADLSYDGVAQVIGEGCRDDYLRAARRINESGADAVWIQHEYGIFGPDEGALVCEFVDRIAVPLVFTFHTVLASPSPRQEAILRHLITRASRVMVMSEQGRRLLIERYDAPAEVLEVIPHGAPDRPFGREAAFKAQLGLESRNVLMTFGLLGPGKGVERVIEALPAILARHPDTLYRIVGATHPNLVASEGERYRESLQERAARLGVEHAIAWENRFLRIEELLDQLEACDIYVTPYLNMQQATSGTLSYAVALGKPVVATPYVHARELLADGVGALVEPNSSDAISEAVIALLDDPARLAEMRRRAYAKGRTTIWSAYAAATASLLRRALVPSHREVPLSATPGLSGVFAMSDATGMLQHSIGIVPDRRHGYCLDDNARALMLMNVASGVDHEDRAKWSGIYASFVQHAWNPDQQRFRNFMHFDRTWCEDVGSEDSNGRALWALGHTVENAPDPDLRRWAMRWFDQVHPILATIDAPRAVGFAMLGAACVLRTVGQHPGAEQLLERGGALLNGLLGAARRPDWAWFEAVLGYDNPRLPQALLEAGALCQREDWMRSGIETLEWIAARQIAASGHFRPIGSETFGHEHAWLPFDQQPLEAQAAVEAARTAYEVTGEVRWIEHAKAAYRWYFGRNDRGVILADLASGRCRDGVTPRGVNENCGAESILAFQLAHHSLLAISGREEPGMITREALGYRPRPNSQSASHP